MPWDTNSLAGNIVMSTLMAVILGIAGCLPFVRHRPRVRYLLWLMVLIKLMPIPGIQIPVHLVIGPLKQASDVMMTDVRAMDIEVDDAIRFERVGVSPSEARIDASTAGPTARTMDWQWSWPFLRTFALLATLYLIVRSVVQTRRISRLIVSAAPAGERIRALAAQSAELMKLRRCPDIRVVSARITPLLWAGGRRPTIVLPSELMERLNDEQIRCVICHELAHMIRRDWWAKLFTFVTGSVYWWNPVTWWAQQELLSAQEECCDALVISRSGLNRKTYAQTLLETIDYLQHECPSSPVLASGFGHGFFMQRRFEMIVKSSGNRRVVSLVVPLVLVFGAAFLSLPVRGQTKADDDLSEIVQESLDLSLAEVLVAKLTEKVDLPASAPTEQRATLDFNKAADVVVDPKKHCLYIGMAPYENCQNGTLRIDLQKGVTYTVRCSGEAFMSQETGRYADPYPGIFFGYETDEQDCHAVRNTILKPGDSITFTTPTCIGEDEDVFAIAYFMQAWKHRNAPGQRGSYHLSFERSSNESKPARAAVN